MRAFRWLPVVLALGGLVAYGCSLNPQPAPPARDDEHAGAPAVSGSSAGMTTGLSNGATTSTTGGLDAGSGGSGGGGSPAEGAGGMAGEGGAPTE